MAEPTLDAALGACLRWMDDLAATGGPDMLPTSARKMETERSEFLATPSLDEAADVAICLAAACADHGWSLDDLAIQTAADFLGIDDISSRRQYEGKPLHQTSVEVVYLFEHAQLLHTAINRYSQATLSAGSTVAVAAEIFTWLILSVRHNGWSVNALTRAIETKHARNINRIWTLAADGTFQHVPTGVTA